MTPVDIGKTTKAYCLITDEYLRAELNQIDIPASLRDAMQYSVFAGGKRLRACLCFAACELFGGEMQNALPFAAAIEMIHTYSLIHDDLPCMDDDDFRRNKPSNHRVFGEALATLAGDGLLSLAFEVLLKTGLSSEVAYLQRHYLAAYEVAHGAGVFGMVAGQVEDMANEGNPNAGRAELEYIQANKTGALISAAIASGAIMGGCDENELVLMRKFGLLFGRLFQLTDDLLDVEGNADVVGKTLGKDKEKKKLTYPALFGIEETKREADTLLNGAFSILNEFGGKAQYLCLLTQQLIGREY